MRSPIVIMYLIILLLCSCRREASISGVTHPQRPLRVNDTAELSVMLAFPSGDEVLQWRATIGKCESNNERALSCRYLAERAGKDTVTVEVLRSGRVIAKTSFQIQVDSVSEGGTPSPPVAVAGQEAADFDEAEIVVTEKPPFGVGGPEVTVSVSGKVSGIARPDRLNIVIYARNDPRKDPRWWVQPLADAPITGIAKNGSWANDTHIGAEYAVLLVLPSYTNPPPTSVALPSGQGILKTLRLRNQN